ncbi:MAG TPA: glycosyltransferase family 4 protein [Sphingomicrobium sp.]|nr:glycosyltransferase family 4 protein [Sphingomicrobium sp.]
MPRERRLLVLASKPTGMSPSQRYRFEQWAPHLAADHGIALDFAPFESRALAERLYRSGHLVAKAGLTLRDYLRRATVLKRAQSYDAVVVHREAALIGPAIYERLLAWSGKPIIYDFDDAIWSPGQAWKNGLFSRLHFSTKTATICRLATAVTTGNAFLAAYARRRNPNVSIIPSSIELANYPVLPEAKDRDRFVVCWTGSVSTLVHFEQARPALERLAALVPLVVKVICSKPPERPITGAEMRFVPWSAEREAHDVADCHVGVMPLPDDEVSRGKGGMKALQFMATGRPVVVSPVGVNAEIVRDTHNGYLARTDGEWVEALRMLSSDPELRARLGDNARNTVEQGYSAEMSASKFAAVVERVIGGRH